MRIRTHRFRGSRFVMPLVIAAAGLSLSACSASSAASNPSLSDHSNLHLTQAAAAKQLKSYLNDALAALPEGSRFMPIGNDGAIPIPCHDDDHSVNPPVNMTYSYLVNNAGTDDSVIATLTAYWSQLHWADENHPAFQPVAVVSPDGYRISLAHHEIGLTIDGSSPCSLPESFPDPTAEVATSSSGQ